MSDITYELANLNDVLSDLCDLLTDEQLDPLTHLADLPPHTLRQFWLEFALLHLSNAVGVEPSDLPDQFPVSVHAYMDVYSKSLALQFAEYPMPSIAKMKMGKFGAHYMLPTLAGLISPDMKDNVLAELGAGIKQMLEG